MRGARALQAQGATKYGDISATDTNYTSIKHLQTPRARLSFFSSLFIFPHSTPFPFAAAENNEKAVLAPGSPLQQRAPHSYTVNHMCIIPDNYPPATAIGHRSTPIGRFGQTNVLSS
jgi:hypothetical protein